MHPSRAGFQGPGPGERGGEEGAQSPSSVTTPSIHHTIILTRFFLVHFGGQAGRAGRTVVCALLGKGLFESARLPFVVHSSLFSLT